MRRRLAVLVGLIACGAVAAASLASGYAASGYAASGSTGAPPLSTLSAGSQISSYQLTADGKGDATIVWSTDGGEAESQIQVSQQNPHGRWSVPVQLGGIEQSLLPSLAESQSGAAVVVWSYGKTIEAVTRSSPGAAWSAPRVIWSRRHVDVAAVTVGIDSAGVATVVWTAYGPADPAIWTAGIDAQNARASRARQLIPAGAGGTNVVLAVNGAGEALLSWQRQLSLTKHRGKISLPTVHAAEMASYRAASGRWLGSHLLARFSFQSEPLSTQIWAPGSSPSTVTANGTAATAWTASGPLEIATRNPLTGSWSATEVLERSGGFGQTVINGPRDSLLALWSSGDQGAFRSATSTDGTDWSTAPVPAHGGFLTFLASDPDGDDAATYAGPHSRILFTTRTAADRWSALRQAGTGSNPEVAVSSSGSITLAWEHGTVSDEALETRTYPRG